MNINSDAIECLCIEILNKQSKNLILNLSYRPPQGDTTLFEKHLQDLLWRHDVCKKEVLITGDFNINLLDFENNKKVQSFVNLMLRCGMVPIINKPTRVTRYTATAIDHMFTNSIINTEIKSAIIKADISDHFPILFVAKVKVDVNIKTEQYILKRNRNLSKNCVMSHGMILKCLTVSIILMIGFFKFFFYCTMNVFQR